MPVNSRLPHWEAEHMRMQYILQQLVPWQTLREIMRWHLDIMHPEEVKILQH